MEKSNYITRRRFFERLKSRIYDAQRQKGLKLDELAELVHEDLGNTFSTAKQKIKYMRAGVYGKWLNGNRMSVSISVNKYLNDYFVVLNALGIKQDDEIVGDLIEDFKQYQVPLTAKYPSD